MTEFTRNSFGYTAPIHWLPVGLLIVFGFVWLFINYRKERGSSASGWRTTLFLLRWIAFTAVVLAGLNWQVETRKFRKPELIFLLDDTASLQSIDAISIDDPRVAQLKTEGLLPTRQNLFQLAWKNQGNLLDELSRDYELVAFRVGQGAKPIPSSLRPVEWVSDLKAEELASNLDTSIRQVLRERAGRRPAALILITDGIASDDQRFRGASQLAAAEEVPIFSIGLGESQAAIDVDLKEVRGFPVAYVNDWIEFEVTLSALGFRGSTVRMEVFANGEKEPTTQREVKITSDRFNSPVRFRQRMTKLGNQVFEFRAVPLDGEFDTTNNRKTKSVEVKDTPIRVLLVSDYPSREFHYLKEFLGRNTETASEDSIANKHIQLDTLLQQGDLNYADTDEHAIKLFPVNKDRLFEYDVIILADAKPVWAGDSAVGLGQSEIDNLREFVRKRGGGLVLIAGPQYLPHQYQNSSLAELFPIDLRRLRRTSSEADLWNDDLDREFRLDLTPLGKRFLPMNLSTAPGDEIDFASFPGAYWLATSDQRKSAAQVLAEYRIDGKRLPGIVIQPEGRGQVLYHASAESYRWRFRSGDQNFGRYWAQMIQHLAVAKLALNESGIQLQTDRSNYFRGEPVTVIADVIDSSRLVDRSRLLARLTSEFGFERTIDLVPRGPGSSEFRGSVSELGPGTYQISLARFPNVQKTIVVNDATRENIRQPINRSQLENLSTQSGGVYRHLSELATLDEILPEGDLVEMGREPPHVLWQDWRFTSLFGMVLLLLLTAEWIGRKLVGMV